MSKYPPEKPSSNNATPGAPSDVGYAPYPHAPAPTDPQAKPKKPSFIKRIAPGQTPAQLLNPAPSSFERPPPPNLPYPPFPPMILIGKEALDKGFLVNLPEASLPWNGPHPFETHDISEEDWARFLHDVKIAASLAPKDRLKAALIPAPIGLLTGGIGAVIGEPSIDELELLSSALSPLSSCIATEVALCGMTMMEEEDIYSSEEAGSGLPR